MKTSKVISVYVKPGQRFGKLIAIEMINVYDSLGRKKWLCKCECGKTEKLSTHLLNGGFVKSCKHCTPRNTDIEKKQQNKKNGFQPKPFGESSFNALYCSYKCGAKSRNLEFLLTKEEFKLLVTSNCFYCNKKPSQIYNRKNSNGSFTYNGVDRIDNCKGYTIKNSRPCCKKCNILKFNLTENEFLNLIIKIYNNWVIKNIMKDHKQFSNINIVPQEH